MTPELRRALFRREAITLHVVLYGTAACPLQPRDRRRRIGGPWIECTACGLLPLDLIEGQEG